MFDDIPYPPSRSSLIALVGRTPGILFDSWAKAFLPLEYRSSMHQDRVSYNAAREYRELLERQRAIEIRHDITATLKKGVRLFLYGHAPPGLWCRPPESEPKIIPGVLPDWTGYTTTTIAFDYADKIGIKLLPKTSAALTEVSDFDADKLTLARRNRTNPWAKTPAVENKP